MNTTAAASAAASAVPSATTLRLSALSLATVLTLAMLLGVNALAQADRPAAHMAQATSAKA